MEGHYNLPDRESKEDLRYLAEFYGQIAEDMGSRINFHTSLLLTLTLVLLTFYEASQKFNFLEKYSKASLLAILGILTLMFASWIAMTRLNLTAYYASMKSQEHFVKAYPDRREELKRAESSIKSLSYIFRNEKSWRAFLIVFILTVSVFVGLFLLGKIIAII